MKKLMTVLLAALMVFALVSCGGGTAKTNKPGTLTVGDYVFDFKGCELTKDSLGADAVLLTYDFTNNSDDKCSFFVSSFYEAYQGETSLNSTTIYVSDDSFDTITKNEFEEIEPGATIEVVIAYELIDTTTPVKVNFEGLFEEGFASHEIDITAVSATDVEEPEVVEPEVVENDVEEIGEFGNSQWYGWWLVENATGEYEDYDGAYFDCCVSFEPTEEGYTLMSIWDEVFTDYYDNCIGEIYLEYYEDLGYSSVGGYFLTGDDIASEGQVMVIPGVSEIENTLFTTVPVETENGGFTATLFLTEWGYEWNEEFSVGPTYYDSYFLPLMEDGESLPKNLDDIG